MVKSDPASLISGIILIVLGLILNIIGFFLWPLLIYGIPMVIIGIVILLTLREQEYVEPIKNINYQKKDTLNNKKSYVVRRKK